jgi:hypothetical protein
MYERRLRGEPQPWTDDPVLTAYRFTNAFRAADRVSQYLIRNVIYQGPSEPDEVLFRILLFKFFNKVETWELLEREVGPVDLGTFSPDHASDVLAGARQRGVPVYSNAYIVPPVPGMPSPKHTGHLRLVMDMIDSGLARRVCATSGLQELFELLRRMPGVGDFLAYQFAIDVAYSPLVAHDENEYVVAGPGALDGLSKVFPGMNLRDAGQVIRELTDTQDEWFERLGLDFDGLFGRPLHLIDVQNLFCEVSKYTRVTHPECLGVSGRTRIKQSYRSTGALPPPWFPPKWRLKVADCGDVVDSRAASERLALLSSHSVDPYVSFASS